MGQTLNHGVYLPAEGERNCYSGLASNWNLLDTAIGDIAGKASATHTHGNITNDGKVGTAANKPLITGTGGAVQAGSFGTSANTFCEGNDSRLSDARTPVAHTHTKSDVIDLFNSANTWTGRNTFAGIELSTTAEGKELLHNTWHGYEQYYTRGTSNYPNYDTFLKWNSTRYDNTLGLFKSVGVLTSTTEGATVDDIDETFAYYIYHINAKYVDFMNNVRIVNDGTSNILAPISNGTTDLGTSTNKWKTLNGVNPGALSLPSGGTTENTDWFNVAGDILPTGGNATSFSIATANYFTPAKDGWLALAVKQCSELSVWCENLKYGISIVAPDASVSRQVVIPVVAGKIYQILITGNSWASARLIMPKGNV